MKKFARFGWIPMVLLAAVAGFFASEYLHRPPAFDLRAIEYRGALRESGDMPVLEVFFATNRNPCGENNAPDFGSDLHDTLHFGRAEIRIPSAFRIGDTQRPDLPRATTDEDYATVEKVEMLSESGFRALLAERMAGQEYAGARIFVPGLNHSFDSGLRQAAALQFGLNLHQPMILFSWPAQPSISLDGYRRSEDNVDASALALEKLLEPYGESRIDLLAHSLGCRVVCRAFRGLMSNDLWSRAEPSLPNVVLAAPDVDAADFTQAFLNEVQTLAGRTTVYVARNDGVLIISDYLHDSLRLGDNATSQTAVEAALTAGNNSRVEIIDASFVNNDFTSHSYFYQNRAVFADLYNLLRNDVPAHQRQLLRHEKAREANYWVIPP